MTKVTIDSTAASASATRLWRAAAIITTVAQYLDAGEEGTRERLALQAAAELVQSEGDALADLNVAFRK